MNKIKLGITGYTGKMGQTIISEARNFLKVIISVAFVRDGYVQQQNYIKLTSNMTELCKLSDVIIDFSSCEIFQKLIIVATEHKTALVSGTTFLKTTDFKLLERAAKKIPIIYSQNMSIGISVLSSLIREVYLKLAEKSDIEIIEMHHKHKKDTPSGTAIFLASKMLNKKNVKPDIIERNLFEASTRPSKKIGISSIRGGTIPGQHDVMFMMENENIKISHQALDKSIFAIGALKAACWLYKKRPGLYSIQDILKK